MTKIIQEKLKPISVVPALSESETKVLIARDQCGVGVHHSAFKLKTQFPVFLSKYWIKEVKEEKEKRVIIRHSNSTVIPVTSGSQSVEETKTLESIPSKKYLSSRLAANARLGNHLFELASLYALSKKLKRIPTFFIDDAWHDTMIKDTDFLIPGLVDHFLIINDTIPAKLPRVAFHMRCCIYENPDRLKLINDEYLHLNGVFYQTWKYFARMRNELVSYLKKPINTFPNLPKSNDSSFITCVHIRRTDFAKGGRHVPDYDFIIGALRFVDEKEKRDSDIKTSYVFFSDDIDYVKSLWNITFISKKNGIEKSFQSDSYISQDDAADSILYASRHCDVVYFTAPHSTFGWWMGYLSKGNQVYYTDINFIKDGSMLRGHLSPEDYYPPHWIPVKYKEPDNVTVIESLK